jgi:AGZA family xanthine/uracil permease-like MFS transporter
MEDNFKYKWITKQDLNPFFSLFFDGFAKILAAVGIMLFAFKMPTEIVMGRVLPGMAIATAFGNFWYAYEAKKLAQKEKRHDVTAQPYGIGAGVVFGWLFLIIGPVFWDTGDAVLAWQVGLAACFIGGLIEILGSFFGKKLIALTPRAALLGKQAAGAFVWLGLVSMLEIYSKPVIALVPLFIVLIAFFGKVKMPFKMPAGLFAILVGTIIAWTTGAMDITAVSESMTSIGFYTPILGISDVFTGISRITPYLPVVIPLQIGNALNTLQGVESASVAGDSYPVRTSMTMDGVGTIVGSLFGNPFPTTVYFGHPGWKAVGARAGYSILNGIAYLVLGLSGAALVISTIIPYQVVMTILVFVALIVGKQAYTSVKKRHVVAVIFAFMPMISGYVRQGVNKGLQAAGTKMAEVGFDAFASDFPVRGIWSLAQGLFLSSLLLAAILVGIIDAKYKQAGAFALVAAFSAFIGLIHAPTLQWMAPAGLPFAGAYAVLGVSCFVIEKYKTKLVDADYLEELRKEDAEEAAQAM